MYTVTASCVLCSALLTTRQVNDRDMMTVMRSLAPLRCTSHKRAPVLRHSRLNNAPPVKPPKERSRSY